MTRAWRIYFGAVAVLFVSLSGTGLLLVANQRSVEAMEAKWARGEKPPFQLGTNPGRGFNMMWALDHAKP